MQDADDIVKLHSLYSVLERIPYPDKHEEKGVKTTLLNISVLCNGTTLLAFADTQEDVKNLLTGPGM